MKATATDFCTNMMPEMRAFCHRLSCGMKPESSTWNPNPSNNQWNDQMTFPMMKFKSVPSAGKIRVVIFCDDRGVVLVNFLPWRTTMNSDHCIKTLRNLNPCPEVHTTR
jgi:hypothetical protein